MGCIAAHLRVRYKNKYNIFSRVFFNIDFTLRLKPFASRVCFPSRDVIYAQLRNQNGVPFRQIIDQSGCGCDPSSITPRITTDGRIPLPNAYGSSTRASADLDGGCSEICPGLGHSSGKMSRLGHFAIVSMLHPCPPKISMVLLPLGIFNI